MGGGVHDSYTFQCGLVGSFTSPGIAMHRHQIEGTNGFLVSHPKDTGKEGLTELPKFRTQSRAGLNDGLFSETMDFPSVSSAMRIAQS